MKLILTITIFLIISVGPYNVFSKDHKSKVSNDLIERLRAFYEIKHNINFNKEIKYQHILYNYDGFQLNSHPRYFIVIKQNNITIPLLYKRVSVQADHNFSRQWIGLSKARLKQEIDNALFKVKDEFVELKANSFPKSIKDVKNSDLKSYLWKNIVLSNWDPSISQYINGAIFRSVSAKERNIRKQKLLTYHKEPSVDKEEIDNLVESISEFNKISLLDLFPESFENYSEAYLISWSSRGGIVPKFIFLKEKTYFVWRVARYKGNLMRVYENSLKEVKDIFEKCKLKLADRDNRNVDLWEMIVAKWVLKLSHLPYNKQIREDICKKI